MNTYPFEVSVVSHQALKTDTLLASVGVARVSFQEENRTYGFYMQQQNKETLIVVYDQCKQLCAFDPWVNIVHYGTIPEKYKTLALLLRRPIMMLCRALQENVNRGARSVITGMVEGISYGELYEIFTTENESPRMRQFCMLNELFVKNP